MNGDFGRPTPSIWTSTILPAAGFASGAARGEPPSLFALTDDEQQMRDRAWRYIMPAHEKSYFYRVLGELARTHVLPKEALVPDPTIYKRAIWATTASPVSRYRRLTDDIDADRALIPPFAAVTARVEAADDIRRGAMRHLSVQGYERENAELRLAENVGLSIWVCELIAQRIEAYDVALNGLVVEVPHKIAVESERALTRLKQDAAAFCASRWRLLELRRADEGRKSRRGVGEPIVVKG